MTKPLRALIVEDSEDDAELLLRELRRGGYVPTHARVETAETMSGELAARAWDIVFSDFTLPQLNAFDTLALLRNTGLDLPFIIVSGTIGEDRAVAALKAGAHDYILKGNLKRLVPAVERELDQAGQRRARSQMEEALREAEFTFRTLADFTWDWEFWLGLDRRFRYVSPSCERITGYQSRELIDSASLFMDIVHPDDRHVVEATMERAFAQQVDTGLEFRITRRDGTIGWVSLAYQPILSDDGGFLGVRGSLRDVTEYREIQDQLRQAQKMEAIGHLAGGIAHDFNNILSAISGYAQLLASDLDPADERRADVERILDASDRAARLIRQLLAFSRRQVLHPLVLDLNAVVRGIDALLRPLVGDTVVLTVALDPDLGTVRADPSQLEQVIMNLVTNARDAMPSGGRLTIETANVELDRAYVASHADAQPGPHVMLAVSDTGVGMDAATMARLFEPFFTTKEPGKGTGLGLATTYGIVKQSGGNIWVYSEPDRGTSFKVYLPRVEDDGGIGAAVDRQEPATPVGGTEVVLLAEDDPEVRALVETILARHGYTVLSAPDGRTALEVAAATDSIALLITDVMMPGLRGPELAERLVALRPGLRVLYISGYAAEAVGNHDVVARGATYLEKPFTPDLLARTVRTILDGPEAGAVGS